LQLALPPPPPAAAAGTGKTLLAKSIAAESGVKMFTCSGTDFYDVYTGVGARRIRETFEKLRNAVSGWVGGWVGGAVGSTPGRLTPNFSAM
jgi:ATP-dependent Zn protease